MVIRFTRKERPIRFLALLLNWNVITGIIESLSRLPGLSFLGIVSNYIICFSILFVALSFLFTFEDYQNWKVYVLIPAWVVMFVLSFLLEPGVKPIAARAFIYFVLNIFCIAVLLQSITDLERLVDELRKYIPVTTFYAALQWLVGTSESGYSMAFSYATMFSMLLCLLLCIREKNKRVINIVFFTVLLATNFRYGSRGSLLCSALLIVVNLPFTAVKKKIKYLVVAVVAFLVASLFWEHILLILQRLFPGSRNVLILTQGIPLYGSGREEIYGRIAQEILRNPFSFRGIYSDRFFLSDGSSSIDVLWGSYTHNIVLEWLYQFGVWCIPAIIAFVAWMIKAFFKVKESDESIKRLTIIIYTFAIGQLMISSSYLISPSFGLLVGLLLWLKRNGTLIASVSSSEAISSMA